MQIENIGPNKLTPWERNPRINSQAVDAVASSIKEFGFNSPILCDENYRILAGHTRWKAAVKLKLKLVPVIVIKLSEVQKKAFSLADNKTAEIATWDFPALSAILNELKLEDFNIEFTGFSEDFMELLTFDATDVIWDDYKKELINSRTADYVRLLVKIPCNQKELVKQSIQKAASAMQISNSDIGIVAGLVLCQLLEKYHG